MCACPGSSLDERKAKVGVPHLTKRLVCCCWLVPNVSRPRQGHVPHQRWHTNTQLAREEWYPPPTGSTKSAPANEGSIQEQPKIPNASQHTTPLQRCPLCHRTNCPEQRTNNTHEPAILSRGKSIAAALQWALGER